MGYALNYYEAISFIVLDWFQKTNASLSFSEIPLCMNFILFFHNAVTSFVEQCYTLPGVLVFVCTNSLILYLSYMI